MSGRDEMPISNLVCPECAKQNITNTHWTLFVGNIEAGNWGRYNLGNDYLDKRYLTRHNGAMITRIKCYHKKKKDGVIKDILLKLPI